MNAYSPKTVQSFIRLDGTLKVVILIILLQSLFHMPIILVDFLIKIFIIRRLYLNNNNISIKNYSLIYVHRPKIQPTNIKSLEMERKSVNFFGY